MPTTAVTATTEAHLANLFTIIIGPTGLAVSLAALAYAIREIRKTKTAADAAAAAAERTSRALVQNHLLFLIPELTRLASGHAGRTSEHLSHWRNAASRARGLLRARGDVPRPVASAFSGAFAAITESRTQLRVPNADVPEATEPAIRAIDKVMDEIGDLGGQMLGDPQGAD